MCKEMEKKQVPRHRMLNKKKDDGYESISRRSAPMLSYPSPEPAQWCLVTCVGWEPQAIGMNSPGQLIDRADEIVSLYFQQDGDSYAS